MSVANLLKSVGAGNSTFHVFNRGVAFNPIFLDRLDEREFLQCFRRHLSTEPFCDRFGRPYRKLHDEIQVLAYCLMPNHFHLIVHQRTPHAMTRLMQSALTGYVKCFNHRHKRVGPLFQSRYNAARIGTPEYAKRAIAYIHLNHADGRDYSACSHSLYVGDASTDWIDVQSGLEVFGDPAAYRSFIDRYESLRDIPQQSGRP